MAVDSKSFSDLVPSKNAGEIDQLSRPTPTSSIDQRQTCHFGNQDNPFLRLKVIATLVTIWLSSNIKKTESRSSPVDLWRPRVHVPPHAFVQVMSIRVMWQRPGLMISGDVSLIRILNHFKAVTRIHSRDARTSLPENRHSQNDRRGARLGYWLATWVDTRSINNSNL